MVISECDDTSVEKTGAVSMVSPVPVPPMCASSTAAQKEYRLLWAFGPQAALYSRERLARNPSDELGARSGKLSPNGEICRPRKRRCTLIYADPSLAS
jgi:hypothetical protein